VASRDFGGIDQATAAFIEHLDMRFGRRFNRDEVLEEWRRLTIHRDGDRIECVLGDRTVAGRWAGIDEHGRALLKTANETLAISAGDVILT
jgi:biotin-(acetyl-CoA carboxylase) ligase